MWLEAPEVLWAVPGAQACRRHQLAGAGCFQCWGTAACYSWRSRVPLPGAWPQANWSLCSWAPCCYFSLSCGSKPLCSELLSSGWLLCGCSGVLLSHFTAFLAGPRTFPCWAVWPSDFGANFGLIASLCLSASPTDPCILFEALEGKTLHHSIQGSQENWKEQMVVIFSNFYHRLKKNYLNHHPYAFFPGVQTGGIFKYLFSCNLYLK